MKLLSFRKYADLFSMTEDQKLPPWCRGILRSIDASFLRMSRSRRSSRRQKPDQAAVNKYEFRVFAPCRSGHHAVINWILAQAEGRTCFLNNCVPNRNPFAQKNSASDSPVSPEQRQEALNGRHQPNQYLLYNYEDPLLEVFPHGIFEWRRERWMGASAHRMDILILRDPFNLFASRLRWNWTGGRTKEEFRDYLRQVWKSIAREALGSTRFFPEHLFISYNKWHSSEAYRKEIASRLGLTFTDSGFNDVARYGPYKHSHSFDGLKFDGSASKMAVLDRWRHYENDPYFLSLFDDPELIDLCSALFDPIPGTEKIIPQHLVSASGTI